ncbi:MAG: GNAT family N-acetyltransferase [Anaerolineales bacterium]
MKNNWTENPLLSPGFSLRPAKWEDAEAVTQLIYDVCASDGDTTIAVTVDELRDEWKNPGFNLETDAWVVTTQDGRIVGFEEFGNRYAHASLQGDGYVHPDFMGNGIGTAMLRALDARAREEMQLAEPGLRVFIRNGMSTGDTVACEMHENEGYKPIRYFWRMEISMDAPPPVPEWPAGIKIRPFDQETHAYQVYRAQQETFSDHWGHTPVSYQEWTHRRLEGSEYDPSLWFIAWDGDEIAGFSLCRYRMGSGWVGALGVRRPWRKRGLGLALLYHGFAEFYRRGTSIVSLGVDAASPTGATRLYKKAGMRVAAEYVTYEKELRPGKEISVQSLDE